MITNNISKRLKQIKAYDSSSSQTIIDTDFAIKALKLLDERLLINPNTVYLDPQCGTGTLLLHLAEILMIKLESAIPDELERLSHIFSKQIYASDIDRLQTIVCNTNFKKALNDKHFKFNVEQKDFKDVDIKSTVVLSSADFTTTNEFVPKFRSQGCDVLLLTRPNKNRYASTHISEISKYKFLGTTISTTPICAMYFNNKTDDDTVEFFNDNDSIKINKPQFLPAHDLTSFVYAHELIEQGFDGFKSNYGSYYINDPKVVNNPGKIQLIYQVGGENKPFRKTVGVDEKIITEREGVGKHKVVISKNGNRGRKSILKYAGPEFGTGHNAIWIQVKDQDEAEQIINYYNSPAITKLILSLNGTSPANGVGFWRKIPHYSYETQVNDIYDKYYS